MAADYEAPSFSLGLDFGFESELQTAAPANSTPVRIDSDVEQEIGPGLDPEIRPQSPRPLKRLKRGLPEKLEQTTPFCSIEDDIEDFSSPENTIQGN